MPRETATLQLLGTPVLRLADGTAVRLRQKAFALAALLSLEFRGRARRGVLAERIWSASSPEQALTNLRQTLLHTRELEARHGFELFDADAAEIELNRRVSLDLDEIGRIRSVDSAAEVERLIGLYRGELLSGVDSFGEDFDQWLRTERTRIEDQFAFEASEAAVRIGTAQAHNALNRLAERLPYSDIVCRTSIGLYLAEGDVAGARMVLDAFRSRLHHGLGLAPAPETAALLDRAGAPLPARPRPERREEPLERKTFVPRVVLLPPLEEQGRARLPRHFAASLVEDVTIGLSRLSSLSVIAPHTAWQLDPFSALDEVRAHQIDYAVESRVSPGLSGDGLSLAIRLVRSSGREIVWADKYVFSLDTAPERYWDFTNGVALALASNIETAELRRQRTHRDANAYSHYLTGRHKLRSFDLPEVRSGRKSLRLARDIDPEQASIEAALARTYVIEWLLRAGSDHALLDKGRLHAERALAIDPTDGMGYRELGLVTLYGGELDLSLEYLERAVERAPNHADLLADYSDALVHNSMFAAAEGKMQQAMRLNPLPPDEYLWTMGGIHFFRERYEEALAELRRMRNQEPAYRLMAAVAAKAGDTRLARDYVQRTLELQPDFSVARWAARVPQRDPADIDFYVDALRRAGFR